MHSECISVIIPVYNAEKKLPRCLDSILEQTYENFELICVDDASEDASLSVCEAYAARDSRIHVLRHPHGGLSSTRNVGMDAATGEYICFVDADDFVEKNYLEYLYHAVNDHGVNIASGGLRYENEDGTKRGDSRVFPARIAEAEEILAPDSPIYQPFVCSKIYRRSALVRSDGTPLRFRENLEMGEDRLFWIEAIIQNGRAWVSTEPIYHYIFYPTSLYNARTYEKCYTEYVCTRKMEELCSVFPSMHDITVIQSVDIAIRTLAYDRFDAHTNELIDYIRAQKRWKIYYSDKRRNRNRRIQALLIGIHPKLYKLVRIVYGKKKHGSAQ